MRTAGLILVYSLNMHAATLEDVRRLIPAAETRPAPKPLKDALRAWAEPHFLKLRAPLAAAAAMNGELKQAGLIPQLGEVKLLHPSGEKDYLVLITSATVICGMDSSTYLYRWRGDHWQFLLASENDGPPGDAAIVIDPAEVLRLSEADMNGDRLFALGGGNQWCSSAWHRFVYRAWLITGDKPVRLLDRAPLAFLANEGFDLSVEQDSLTVRLWVEHPNPAKHSAAITETYKRAGGAIELDLRTFLAFLEDLDEDSDGDPRLFLLHWAAERIALSRSLAYTIEDLNAKLARFQLPKAVSPARLESLPSADENQATLILHTAGKQTRRTLIYRNGQWEMSGE